MGLVRELNLEELMLTLETMLIFPEGEYWAYYCSVYTDPEWWRLRLKTRRN